MSTFKIDNAQVKSSVETLRTLLAECEEAYNKKIPESTQDKGSTHDELNELCNNLKTTCYYLGELINNSILFLGKSSDMFEQSDKNSASAISVQSSNTIMQIASGTVTASKTKTHTGHNSNMTASVGKIVKETISGTPEDAKSAAKVMEWLDGKWIDEQFSELPLSVREYIKKALEEAGKGLFGENFGDAYDVTQKILDGDYLGALKDVTGVFYKDEGVKGLGPKFVINSIFGMTEECIQYAKEPSLENLLSVGWSGTVGSVFETCGEAAWDVAKYIPGVSDWYGEHGATDMSSAFNVAYTETVRAIFGDDMADYCGSYYANNGGLFGGLVNGFKEIKRAVDDSCDKHGGIMGVWLNGWNSIFS